MEKEYLELVRQLMKQRGIGGIITRKELVREMVRQYKPGAFHKPNSILRGGVETCFDRFYAITAFWRYVEFISSTKNFPIYGKQRYYKRKDSLL